MHFAARAFVVAAEGARQAGDENVVDAAPEVGGCDVQRLERDFEDLEMTPERAVVHHVRTGAFGHERLAVQGREQPGRVARAAGHLAGVGDDVAGSADAAPHDVDAALRGIDHRTARRRQRCRCGRRPVRCRFTLGGFGFGFGVALEVDEGE